MSDTRKKDQGSIEEEGKFELLSFDDQQAQNDRSSGKAPVKDSDSFESFQKSSDGGSSTLEDIHFIQDYSVVSSVEDYALRVREDAEDYAKKLRKEADDISRIKKEEIEIESKKLDDKKALLEAELKDIKEEYDKHYDRIYKEAHKEGYRDGHEEALEKAGENIDRINFIASQMDDIHRKILRKYELEIINLSLLLASKIVMHEISEKPDFMADNLQELIESVEGGGRIKLTMHPDDHSFMQSRVEALNSKIDAEGFFSLELDERLQPGSVSVETDFFYLDIDLANRFENIRKEIYKAYFDRIARQQNTRG